MDIAIPIASLSLSAAQTVAAAALIHAHAAGLRVCVAVVDHAGLPLVLLRQPGCSLHAADMAADKAYTAVSFRRATSAWPELLQGRSAAVRDTLPRRPHFVLTAGGLPITIDGQTIGAVGVSGAMEGQDEACAQAGLLAIGISV